MKDLEDFIKEKETIIDLIDGAIVEMNNEPPRDYLGASSIGGPCDRRSWYSLNGYRQEINAKTLRAFQDGHDVEEKIISWLKASPKIELHYKKPNGEQYGFSDLAGKYRGHYDGVIRGIPEAPKTWHMLEVKCTKDFKKVERLVAKHGEKQALKEWNPGYYAQAVTYMWKAGLSRHLTIVSSPGGRDLLSIRTNQNHTYAKALMDKAKRIIESDTPPQRIGESTYYLCKMCGFRNVCHAAT